MMSFTELMDWPSIEVIVSPGASPAFAAGLSGSTWAIVADWPLPA